MEHKSQIVVRAIRIAAGCCLSIWIAQLLHLEYAVAAGSITFLSVITTRWESLRLMGARLVGFCLTASLAWVIFHFAQSRWLAFGLFVFLLALVTDLLGWRSTLAVNVVIGTHFLSEYDFGAEFIFNELLLVLVGTTVGFCANLFQTNALVQRQIRREIASADKKMQEILRQIADGLQKGRISKQSAGKGSRAWEETAALEEHLQSCLAKAYEYRDNHFATHPEYYACYFEMRLGQCEILDSLQEEMGRLRRFPVQAEAVAEILAYVAEHVMERNEPAAQLERLERLLEDMKRSPLPVSREEFENRAVLYHILMELEEFLKLKKKFVELLTEEQVERYWGKPERQDEKSFRKKERTKWKKRSN